MRPKNAGRVGTGKAKCEMKMALLMKAGDNVAIALNDLMPGDGVAVRSLLQETVDEFKTTHSVPYGHKVCVKALMMGAQITKNGEVIGIASQPINRGEHAHIHNIVSSIVPPPRKKSSGTRGRI